MSAVPPKADMDQQGRDIRFVPKADKVHRSKKRLFDHLVGAREQGRDLWLRCNARQDSFEKCHSMQREVLDLAANPDQIH
jgi:hypothetical protein